MFISFFEYSKKDLTIPLSDLSNVLILILNKIIFEIIDQWQEIPEVVESSPRSSRFDTKLCTTSLNMSGFFHSVRLWINIFTTPLSLLVSNGSTVILWWHVILALSKVINWYAVLWWKATLRWKKAFHHRNTVAVWKSSIKKSSVHNSVVKRHSRTQLYRTRHATNLPYGIF